MKSKLLTATLALVLSLCVVLTGCNRGNTPAQTSSQTPSADGMLFGVIQEPIAGFEEAERMPQIVPSVYEENGLYGYKNADGSVLVEAQFSVANDFYQGYGNARRDTVVDGETRYEWMDVTHTGKLIKNDWLTYDETIGLWFVSRDSNTKNGVLDADGNAVISVEYAILTKDSGKGLCCAVKDGEVIYFDLKKGCSYTYEPYREERKDLYCAVEALDEYDLAIVGYRLTVNGEEDMNGHRIPLRLLQDIDWDIYRGTEKIATSKVTLTNGDYEGTISFVFDALSDTAATDCFAVPSYQNALPDAVEQVDEAVYDLYKPAVERYLKEQDIENTPYAVEQVFVGNFLENGTRSAVLCVHETDAYRDERWNEPWTAEQYKENKTAIFSTILLIPDCDKPEEYRVQQEIVLQEAKATMGTRQYLCGVADVLKPAGYDYVVEYVHYESFDVGVCPLQTEN